MEQYYKSTNKFANSSFLLWLVVALIALPILATAYAYAIWYIPFPYLNMFITGFFGLAVGTVISIIVIKIGKVRNGKLSLIFGIFGALLALYFHWAVWVDLAFNISGTIGTDDIGIAKSNIKFTEVLGLTLNPTGLFSIMGEINKVGVWGIKQGTVSGGFLTFIWIVEILIVVVTTIMVTTTQSAKPFCETENEWYKEKELSPIAHFTDIPALTAALSTNDTETLTNFLKPAPDVKSDHHAKVTLYDAKSGSNYVSITNEIAREKGGEVKFSTEYVTSFLKISQEVAEKLKTVV